MTETNNDRNQQNQEDEKIGVGIIGTGMWSGLHAMACKANPYTEIVGLGDINEKAAESYSARHGLDVPIFMDYRDLLKMNSLDAVMIVTPNNYHAPISIAAIEAGKHTMCEKPMSSNFTDAKAMVAAAENSTVRTMIGFTNRFYKGTRFLYDFLREEDLGRLFHVRAFWFQSWLTSRNMPAVWRLEKEKTGTGCLGDLGAHITDLAQHLLDDTITRVTGMMKTFTPQRPSLVDRTKMQTIDVDDAVMFGAEFKKGAMGVFESSRNGTGRHDHWGIEIGAEKGMVSFDSIDGRVLFSTISGPVRHVDSVELPAPPRYGAKGSDTRPEAFQLEVDHFVECIRSGKPPSPSFSEALKTERVLDAVARSAQTGMAVDVEET
jgi:predicted dehydrogenase